MTQKSVDLSYVAAVASNHANVYRLMRDHEGDNYLLLTDFVLLQPELQNTDV